MEIVSDFAQQSFRTWIAGTAYSNDDGSSRQALLSDIERGDMLTLVHEPANVYDKYAVAVFCGGKQLGYVANPTRDRRLSDHLDMGGEYSATVVNIEYDGGFLAFFFKRRRKNYRAFIYITKFNKFPQDTWEYDAESRRLEDIAFAAQQCEKASPDAAVVRYRQLIDRIFALDGKGIRAAAWRRCRYPVNQLSLTLFRLGRFQEALDEILRYEQFTDWYGLYKTDYHAIEVRKKRLLKKLDNAA